MELKKMSKKINKFTGMITRYVVEYIDPKTKEKCLIGHCACPNTWHEVKEVKGVSMFGCFQCGVNMAFISGKWTSGSISPDGDFFSDEEMRELMCPSKTDP
jgi:hypothetical protein